MSNISGKVKGLLGEKTVQIALVGAVLFYILASPAVFAFVDGIIKRVFSVGHVPLKLEGNTLVVIHSLVFGLFLYLSVIYLLEPLTR
tara:strand:+ start:244 stop:504 length:261 start_codon:yes stop_codon:yes gene_type:complete